NLLRDDGAIFISIDDNEVSNLRKLCDEIFGEENFLAQFAWRTDGNFDNQAKIKKTHEYILVYAKNIESFPHPPVVDPSVPSDSKLYRDEIRNTIVKNGPKNPISNIDLPMGFPADFDEGIIQAHNDSWPHYITEARIKNGKLTRPVVVRSGWSSKDLALEFIQNGCQPVIDIKGQSSRFVISRSGAIEVIKDRSEKQSHVISSLSGFGGPQKASAEIEALGVIFDDYPKPAGIIKYFVQMITGDDFIAIDFFSGSATTAHAVLDLNQQDKGNRKFILVQLPEPCPKESEAFKAGYKTIADIGKERIRRVIKKLEAEENGKLALVGATPQDRGFKVLKLDKSNFKQWQPLPSDTSPEKVVEQLKLFVNHIEPKAGPEDLLYEILIKAGFPPSEPIATQTLAGKTVYAVSDGGLLLCLEETVTPELINAVVEANPQQFICLDAAFGGNDQLKANAVQTFAAHNLGKEKYNQIVFRTV
ncbi:MAG: site-specific DNA-methyltransferase, partial [Desulfobulbaceae bacterium]|nr:site-specific DNA-methyltransferase [Desulfobulbaceae bacterium]